MISSRLTPCPFLSLLSKTPFPVSTPDVFIFFDFHAQLSPAERLTPLFCTEFSLQFGSPPLFLCSGERKTSDEKEILGVGCSLVELQSSPGCQETIQQVQV